MVTIVKHEQNHINPTVRFQFVTVSENILEASTSGILSDYDVLLDNCATGSLFKNDMLLSNIREGPSIVEFNGVGGKLSTNLIGDLQFFGSVPYSPDAPANILSFAEVEDNYKIDFIQTDSFTVSIPVKQGKSKFIKKIKFIRKNKLYDSYVGKSGK